jgi:TRAP transporter TAXI family solute receptor
MRYRIHFAVAAVCALMASSASAQTISIGTSPAGASTYALASALGKVVAEKTGLKVRLIPFGGMEQWGPMMNTGKIDIGIGAATDVSFAIDGKAMYQGKPEKNIRAVASLYSFYVGFLVRKDSPIKSVADLKGKRVPTRFSNQKAALRHYEAALALAGLTEKDLSGVPTPNVIRAAQDFVEGKTDATWFAIGAGKVSEVDAQVSGIRFLPVPDSPEAIARMRNVAPAAYISTLPAGRFTGVAVPTKSVTEDYMLVAGKHVPDDVVQKFAKVLFESKTELGGMFAAWKRYDPQKLGRNLGENMSNVPFHPGAVAYYKSIGIWQAK